MATPEELQAQLNYEVAVYREQLTMLKRETERVSLTTMDLANALRTVESLGTERVLMPIGGGSMIKGTVSETNVLMPIGAEYMLEMKKEQAVVELNRRIEATKKAVERLNEEFTKIMTRLQQVSGQLEQLDSQVRISERGEESMKEDYL
ncbi:MAG: prefoldin subunit alpha [Candidatus ainarchaeum sp.]|nr:prefoldin subunit alpha [Candidatus ainarchaeum sp.]